MSNYAWNLTIVGDPSERFASAWLLLNRFSGYVLLAFWDDPALIAFSFC
jgi:hypothetical protein